MSSLANVRPLVRARARVQLRDADARRNRRRALTRAQAMRAGWALLGANARYWTTVAPRVRCLLAAWEQRARVIEDPRLRALALGKLRAERFNVEVAATLATIAERTRRVKVVEAIVALQIAYDYLDALGERGAAGEDGGYLRELLERTRRTLGELPAASAVTDVVHAGMERCLQAQARGHAQREDELESWARGRAAGSGLGWVEWLAGAQASVLCAHALIAAAADPATTRADAEAIDRAYLAIGALSMLDSLLDRDEDAAAGQVGYLSRYDGAERMGERLAVTARTAARRAGELSGGPHHLMTLAGVIAYYGSAPPAGERDARAVLARVCGELAPLAAPALATMHGWRAAKRAPIVFSQVISRRGR